MNQKFFITASFILFSSIVNAASDVNLSSPEEVLAGFIECFETADLTCVLTRCRGIDYFHMGNAQSIFYKITKKVTFGSTEVEEWNSMGIARAAKLGDVVLDVEQIAFVHEGKTSMHEGTYSYTFRKEGNNWYLIARSTWIIN